MFLVEHQDRARHLAGLHRAKRLVDVLEAATARDHLVELELPLTIQFDVARHVDLEAVRAHGAALDLLLAQERRAVELDLLADRDHADDRRGAARTQTLEHLLGRLLEADRLERVVHAGARELADRLDGIRRGGVHGVRGAELLCRLELVGDDVHRDDHPRTGDHRALDRREPDAAGAVHGHRRTRLDTRGVEDGADAGGHAAADQSRAIERHVVPHLHQPALVDQHLLGVGREIGELVDRRPFHDSFDGSLAARTGRLWQRCVRPVRQYSQWPQKTERHAMTWSPGLNSVTCGPTDSTIPAASWPRMAGAANG